MEINGVKFHLKESDYEYYKNNNRVPYYHLNHDINWHDKRFLTLYNFETNETYYVEKVWPNVGDNNLLFIDFPRTDGPTYSWASYVTQYAKVLKFNSYCEYPNEFSRCTINYIDKDNFCKISNQLNNDVGWYARSCFYKILKIFKF